MPQRDTERREDRVLAQLCGLFSAAEGIPAWVLAHPDRDGVDGGCDAIIQRGGCEWAAEHTLVHSRPGERGHLKRLDAIRGPIVETIVPKCPGRYIVVALPIEQLPRPAVCNDLARAIATACVGPASRLRQGSREWVVVPGCSIRVLLACDVDLEGGPGLCSVHPLSADPARTVEDIKRALDSKSARLTAEKQRGRMSLLVLDGESLAWYGESREAFQKASDRASLEAYDEIVWASSAFEPICFNYLKIAGQVLPAPSMWSTFWDAQIRLSRAMHSGMF